MLNRFSLHGKRFRIINPGKPRPKGAVVYWMHRNLRARDNWALCYAIEQANLLSVPLIVLFIPSELYHTTYSRHNHFMLKGLRLTEQHLREQGIGMQVIPGNPSKAVITFIDRIRASILISDFDPLTPKRLWNDKIGQHLTIPHIEVDARNIVPCFRASDKFETDICRFRSKLYRELPRYLTDYPELEVKIKSHKIIPPVKWNEIARRLDVSSEVPPLRWLKSGEDAATEALADFIKQRLNGYAHNNANPNLNGLSNLSPYLSFGQLSAQRVALEIRRAQTAPRHKEAFLEKLIVQRELADNYCYYTPYYNRFAGFPEWSRKTHAIHRYDVRKYLYERNELELAQTHDPLWNATQLELVNQGKIHSALRQYWAKKILEWTTCPEEALQIAIYLNNKYGIDGRSSNGYAGIACAIGGIHDQSCPEHPIFGNIRHIDYDTISSQFNIEAYIYRNLP